MNADDNLKIAIKYGDQEKVNKARMLLQDIYSDAEEKLFNEAVKRPLTAEEVAFMRMRSGRLSSAFKGNRMRYSPMVLESTDKSLSLVLATTMTPTKGKTDLVVGPVDVENAYEYSTGYTAEEMIIKMPDLVKRMYDLQIVT